MSSQVRQDEQAILQVNNIVIKFESGLGNNTIPLLLLESHFSCNVKDWSSKRMSVLGSIDVELAYYNSMLGNLKNYLQKFQIKLNDFFESSLGACHRAS